MRASAAVRRYARALFGLAQEASRPEKTLAELDALVELLASNDSLRDALLRPLHPARQRQQVLDAVAARLKASATVRQFCAVLIEHRRLGDFFAIRDEFERLVNEAGGRVQAQVRTASPLQKAQRSRLQRALSARTGKEVQIEVEVDPSLIGGVVARVGDLVFDGSLRTQLDQLRINLTKGR
jgi:F-type H+-transporting ATPase subunit delta